MGSDTRFRALAATLALAILAGQAVAQEVIIRSNTVVPIVMDDELSFKESREGDRFSAHVEDSRDFPSGTRLEGRILTIERKRDDRPAFMDVEFDTLLLPDNSTHRITAVPISLDSKYVARDRDGRLTAKKGAIRKDQYVWGGVIGGALLGSILGRKTFEGAFVGAVAGIILAESNAKQEEVALKRGTRMGALFDREVRIDFNGRWDDRRGGDDVYSRQDGYGRDDRRTDTYRSNDIRVEFDGRELRFSESERPYRMGDTVMVPLERTASQMSLDVEFANKIILIEDDDSILRLEQDSDQYRLNGRRGSLSRNVVKRSGVVYVPLEILAGTKSESVYVNGNKVRNNT